MAVEEVDGAESWDEEGWGLDAVGALTDTEATAPPPGPVVTATLPLPMPPVREARPRLKNEHKTNQITLFTKFSISRLMYPPRNDKYGSKCPPGSKFEKSTVKFKFRDFFYQLAMLAGLAPTSNKEPLLRVHHAP